MSVVKDLKTKITKKTNERSILLEKKADLESEIETLDKQILEADLFISHHESFLRLVESKEESNDTLSPDSTKPKRKRRRALQKSSLPYKVLTILKEAKKTMHLDDIIKIIERNENIVIKKPSLQSSLNTHARDGFYFTAHGGNYFSALELEGSKPINSNLITTENAESLFNSVVDEAFERLKTTSKEEN